MKRGNEEKVMDPMFPRLHVNDADKGGPRAPPRNKMALYEQLSIPSQRFNPAVLPMNPNSNSSVVPSAFSSQGSRSERNFPFPVHAQPSTPTRQAEMFQARQSEGANVNMPLAQPEQRTKVGDEDDFRVPVFVQSRMGLCHSKPQTGIDKEKVTRISPPHSGHSVKLKNVKDLKQVSSPTLSLRRELGSEREDVSVIVSDLARDHAAKSATKISTRQKVDGPVEEVCASPNQDYAEYPATRFNRLSGSDACLLQDPRSGSQPNITGHGDGLVESTREVVEKGTASQKRSVSCSGEDASSPNEPDNNSECHGDRMGISPEMGHAEKSDDVSETSMVDSISGFDISPDDVVGIIGQKHFWKARKAIVNQQRLFAVQVFELHRLIKVQRLIAESPNLLLEDAAFLGASSLRCSPAKKLSSEYVVKPLLHVVKRKHEPEKTNNKMECSAENAVGKTSISFVKNGSQTSNYAPYLGNSPPARVTTDNNKANPWCFHQSPGHQLLIPVMSPSEGLVYKPYSGPGFMGPACGGCGPYSSTPMTGNFVKPLTYGAPSSHHQGMGVLPLPPPLGHTYFPPYGMSVVNPAMPSSAVEQLHWVAGPGSHGQIDQLSGGADSNMQHQSSCNIPSQKNGAVSHAKASNDSELQGSTANSPGDRAQAGTNQNTEESDALQLFPMAPVTQEEVPQSHDIGQPTRAIKVVPHNARTATASAARIFQSIQAERKQYD